MRKFEGIGLEEDQYEMYGGNRALKSESDSIWKYVPKRADGKLATPINVVYDGNSPYIAAKNLEHYINAMGYETCLVGADEYRKGHAGSVIVVGHHSLAKEFLIHTGIQYDRYGMRYGVAGNVCVLYASRSALEHGKKGRKQFAEHYDMQVLTHTELAIKYRVPLCYGYRSKTRKSQYDLLWLEFVKYGLSTFLDENNLTLKKPNDFVKAAVNDLVQKMEDDNDVTFTLDELLRNNFEQLEREGIETLHTHLGKNIVFTGLWSGMKEERELEDNELLEGELSAVTFKIGCYIIRSAMRLYQDKDGIHYTERVPVTKDMLDEYKKNCAGMKAWFGQYNGVRKVHEISATYTLSVDEISGGEWKFICLATDSRAWSESVDFIGTVKKDSSVEEEQAELFVLKTYTGSSYGVANWYKFTPSGELKEYQEHPYDSDSFKKSWNEE